MGWPAHFADSPDEGSAFLTHAAYLGDDGNVIEIPGPGILVTKEAGIRMIEFLRDDDSTEIIHARINRRSEGRL